MVKGVDVDIRDGVAELDFADAETKHTILGKLIELGGGGAITVDTGGTKRTYKVPEELAERAGLVDKRRAGARKSNS